MQSKPLVLVCVLCGSERHSWIHPRLSTTLINLTHDPRFQVQLEWISGARPVDHARNLCVSKARALNVNWLVMVDNDVTPSAPLDVIAQAKTEMDIIGLSCGADMDGTLRLATHLNGEKRGEFLGVGAIGAGCLMLRETVWTKIPSGPWFRWVSGDDELLGPKGGCGEDVYFCRLALASGFKLWTHPQLAGHFHTTDLTELALKK